MTIHEQEILLARIQAVRMTVSDDVIRTVFDYMLEIAEKLPVEQKNIGFHTEDK